MFLVVEDSNYFLKDLLDGVVLVASKRDSFMSPQEKGCLCLASPSEQNLRQGFRTSGLFCKVSRERGTGVLGQ